VSLRNNCHGTAVQYTELLVDTGILNAFNTAYIQYSMHSACRHRAIRLYMQEKTVAAIFTGSFQDPCVARRNL
jgi:hypothetical protein